MRVLVLGGGTSDEREVSLRSAQAVTNASTQINYSVISYDPIEGLEGLARFTGQVDVVFPVLHGKAGEDGTIQAQLEQLGLKYVGADSRVSALCFDKNRFRQELTKLGITIPSGQLVTKEEFIKSPLSTKPFVLKPNQGGSSIDTYVCQNLSELRIDTDALFDRYPQMLLEELIAGTEITVPVLLDQALPVIEIIPPDGEEFDYENKYNGKTQENCPPTTIGHEIQVAAQRVALAIHQKLGVRHLSRTDMIITPSNQIYVLELNTIPGMTAASLFPKAAAATGIPMPELVKTLVNAAANPN